MWMSWEDARSDWVLAAATTAFGGIGVGLLLTLPLIPRGGLVLNILELIGTAVVIGLVPYLLARYRDDVPGAFAPTGGRAGVAAGIVVVAPIVVAEMLNRLIVTGSVSSMLLDRLNFGSPVVSSGFDLDRIELTVINVLEVLVIGVAGWLLLSFIVVRARDAFRSPDMDLTEAVRTFGMGSVAAGLVIGIARGLAGVGVVPVLLSSAAVALSILLADRYVPARATTQRATILAPALLVLALHLFSTGILSGAAAAGLHRGFTAAGLMVALSALVEVSNGWAVLPITVAVAIWPTCSALLPFGPPGC